MSNDMFDDLKRLRPPAIDPKARDEAMLTAMEQFDSDFAEKFEATQGSASVRRQNSIDNPLWSAIMNSVVKPLWTIKPATATALGALILTPTIGMIGWSVFNETGPVLPGSVSPANLETQPLNESRALTDGKQKLEQVADAQPKREADESGAREEFAAAEPMPRGDARPQAKKLVIGRVAQDSRDSGLRARKPAPVLAESEVRPVLTNNERYERFDDSAVKSVVQDPVSTFSIDVDTASYARVRRSIMQGALPPKDMVRVEELVNYFDYDYSVPQDRAKPFKPTVTIMPTPWNADTRLLHIGIKGFDIPQTERPKANLVFLLDVSGSMNQPDKLPLLVKSFRLLLQKLNPTDTVSIVTYAGRAATLLEPTPASDRAKVLSALNSLGAGGSTGGAEGIERAYELAAQGFVKDGVNRVMLATDGDFNVGLSDPEELKDFIAQKRKSGIFLSVFGFGQGNYNDALMQALAQNGNGTAAYIDTLAEAQKTLVEEAGSTLFPIAKDVKIQVEFNPTQIAEYRLIGYETRALKREDFNNDKVDAGDIGAGHSVTAIYELTPSGSPAVLNDPLRYSSEKPQKQGQLDSDEWGFLKLRYKLPQADQSTLQTAVIEPLVVAASGQSEARSVAEQEANFAAAVAAFGQKLRGQSAVSAMSYEDIATLAGSAKGDDRYGYRAAFVQLVRMAGSLAGSLGSAPKQ